VDDWWAKKQLKIDMEMIVMFNDDEDPDLVYRRLENVQTRYAERPKVKPSCADLFVQLVDGSTSRYQNLYTNRLAEIRIIDHEVTQDDIDLFQRLANVVYNTTNSGNTIKKTKGMTNHSFKDSKGNDLALFTAPSNKGNGRNGRNRRNGGNNNADGKKFTGVCYHCNKKGHKANQCWQKDKGHQDGKR